MKAAMQAAMELEGRLESLEGTFEAFQECFKAFQERAVLKMDFDALEERVALRADFEALEEREKTARQDLLVAVAKKADLEQLGQCLQAVRHELGEVVKRKANSELVDSNLRELRQEVLKLLKDQRAGLEGLRGQTEAFQAEVAAELQNKAGSWDLERHAQALQVLADEAARRSDLDHIEQFIERELPVLLHRKADSEALQRLEGAHVQLADAVKFKVNLEDMKAFRQEVLRSMQCKANTDYLEQRLQDSQDAQQKISDALQLKADAAQVQLRAQEVEELGRRLDSMSAAKADREKVVEIVEAVRDEVTLMLKKRPDFEEHFSSSLRQLSEQLKEKADEFRVDQRLRMIRQDVVSMVVDKADIDLVTDRVGAMQQSVTDQVAADLHRVQEEIGVLISRKADIELVDRRLDSIQRSMTEALKSRPVFGRRSSGSKDAAELGKKPHKGGGYWKDGHFVADDNEDATSEGTTCEGGGSEAGTCEMNEMEEWMDHRMRLVKIELTKLVDKKADADRVTQSMNEMRQEVSSHVDQRVSAAQQTIAEHVDRQAQAMRKELKADVHLLTECMSQVEQTFEALGGDKALPIKGFHEVLGSLQHRSAAKAEPPPAVLPKQKAVEVLLPRRQDRPSTTATCVVPQESYSPDDLRTRRVRDLLTQLVIPESQQ